MISFKIVQVVFVFLFTLSLNGYTYRNSQEKVIVKSNHNTNFIRQVYRQLNISSNLVNYTLGVKQPARKIFLIFGNNLPSRFHENLRYTTSENKLKNKNYIEILHILNELALKRVFNNWQQQKTQKLSIPRWLIFSYTSKNKRELIYNQDLLIISPFLCQRIAEGNIIDLKKLLSNNFQRADIIFYDVIIAYSEMFFNFLKTLGGIDLLKKALLLNDNNKFYQFYNQISLEKKKVEIQKAFNNYCLAILSTLPYKQKVISFDQFTKKNLVVNGEDLFVSLKKNKVNDKSWYAMHQKFFSIWGIYPSPFAKKIFLLIDDLKQIGYQEEDSSYKISNLLKTFKNQWNNEYEFYNKRQIYFDSFYSQQRLYKKHNYLFEQLQNFTNYNMYEEYFLKFNNKKK